MLQSSGFPPGPHGTRNVGTCAVFPNRITYDGRMMQPPFSRLRIYVWICVGVVPIWPGRSRPLARP